MHSALPDGAPLEERNRWSLLFVTSFPTDVLSHSLWSSEYREQKLIRFIPEDGLGFVQLKDATCVNGADQTSFEKGYKVRAGGITCSRATRVILTDSADPGDASFAFTAQLLFKGAFAEHKEDCVTRLEWADEVSGTWKTRWRPFECLEKKYMYIFITM